MWNETCIKMVILNAHFKDFLNADNAEINVKYFCKINLSLKIFFMCTMFKEVKAKSCFKDHLNKDNH